MCVNVDMSVGVCVSVRIFHGFVYVCACIYTCFFFIHAVYFELLPGAADSESKKSYKESKPETLSHSLQIAESCSHPSYGCFACRYQGT